MADFIKANNIVKNHLLEEWDRINILKYKIKERFPLIHYIYLLVFSKICSITNDFGIQNKNNFDFHFHLHHLHHSLYTRKIFDYAHDFCNTTLVEKSTPEIPLLLIISLVLIYFII